MFYSHDILQKRGGKFGIIWIAATKGVALSKRDYCSVCVTKSCDDIVKYITLQALPHSGRKGSRPRLSLYLSSQLMIGVARVFEKQVNYFIVEVNELHKRTTGFRASSFDDVFTSHTQLKKSTRSGDFCTMPESSLFNDEEFGVMRSSWDTTPDPLLLPEIEMFSVSPYRTAKLSTSLLELSPTQMDKLVLESPPHVVSSASEISLRDEESHSQEEIQIPDIELPPLEGVDDDLMKSIYEDMAVAEQIQENEEEANLSQLASFGLDQLWEVDQHTGQLMLSPSPKGAQFHPRHSSSPHHSLLDQLSPIPSQEALLLSPTGPGVQEPLVEGPDVEAEPVEVEGAELEEAAAPKKPGTPGMETPGTGPVLQNILRLSPIDSASPTPVRRGRKRRLVFADDSIQLSKKDIRRNMETVGDLARKETIISPSHPTAKELFEEPARKALKKNRTLYDLWKSHSELRRATTDPEAEDIDAPAWSTAYMRPRAALPGSSSDTTSKEEQEEEEEDDERALLVKQIPEVLRHEISVSPERMRDISMETSQPRTKFEDTPQSLIVSDASHLSESKDSSRVKSFHSDPPTGHRSLHRPTGDSFKEMEEAIPEELMDMRELPLLPEEDIMMDQLEEEPAIPSAPEMISTSEDEEVRKAKKKKQGKKKPEETIVPQDNVLRGIGVLTEELDSISFTDLVPPRTYRSVAAKIFSVCLEYAAMRLITLTQERPFGNIKIQRGPDFD